MMQVIRDQMEERNQGEQNGPKSLDLIVILLVVRIRGAL
jgi:hypothetical protein